jgi:hypothetical protein
MTRRKSGAPDDAPDSKPSRRDKAVRGDGGRPSFVTREQTQPGQGPPRREPPKAAFDLFLERGLHDMFDDVKNEPIPDELLRLINADRPK